MINVDKANRALHALLLRQLKRNQINISDIAFHKPEQWSNFLSSISKAYFNYEQDLYLLERSMTLSSNELIGLNEKMEAAQALAHLGYWRYDRITDLVTWSNEMYQLTGFDPEKGAPSLTEILGQMSEEQRLRIMDLMQQAFATSQDFSTEVLYRNKMNGQNYWHLFKVHPEIETNHSSRTSVRYLTGIVMDITDSKQHAQNIETMHQQLMTTSRQAGMAEVATSILHNIGNILNSVNVSIDLVKDNLSKPYYEKLSRIATMLKEHQQSLDSYLTKDNLGKLIPNYLIELCNILLVNQQKNMFEVDRLHDYINHIKEIVAMQKNISGTSGLIEKVFIPDTIETALQLTNSAQVKNLNLCKIYDDIPTIYTDKSKLLQIFINLMRNAIESVLYKKQTKDHAIEIVIKKKRDKIQIAVKDDGGGVLPENITKIFSFGFTTKKDGHGFGLHTSALLAKELGGTLQVMSPGKDLGTTFTLTLPITKQ